MHPIIKTVTRINLTLVADLEHLHRVNFKFDLGKINTLMLRKRDILLDGSKSVCDLSDIVFPEYTAISITLNRHHAW